MKNRVFSEYVGSAEHAWPSKPADHWFSERSVLLGIGSCFAINFSRWISLYGVRVLSPPWGMHYNPATILCELRRAVGNPVTDVIWQSPTETGELFVDAQRHMITGESFSALQEKRQAIIAISSESFNLASAFLITLGLSELWEELVDGAWIPLNQIPPDAVYDPSIHRTRTMNVQEVSANILAIIDIIRSHRGNSVPIIFTVSPVPLRRTATGKDARVANTYSKSVLIAGLHSVLADRQDFLFYFPAFELFWGVPSMQYHWQRDGRHPTAAAIEIACRTFVQMFAEDATRFAASIDFTVKAV